MRSYKIFLIKLLLIVLVVFIISCTKNSDKDRLIKLYNLSKEFTLSEEFKKYIKEPNDKIRYEFFDKKEKELLSKAGFKDRNELMKTEEKYLEDEDVIKVRDEYEQIWSIRSYEASKELEQDSLLKLQKDSLITK